MREGLTPSENKTLDIIVNELFSEKRKRIPIITEYIKQLGLRIRSKKYGIISIKRLELQKKKNILRAAKKAFNKHLLSKITIVVVKNLL